MNKRKPLLMGLSAMGVASAGIYQFVENVYQGSRFLMPYIKKAEYININSNVRLEEDGYYSITKTDDKPFRVLQITDLHIGGGYLSRHEDMQALSIMIRAIKSTSPDLIVLTGDLACPVARLTLSRNNLHSYRMIAELLENIGIPYAVVFGNHDTAKNSTHNRRELAQYLMTKEHCLMAETQDTEVLTGFSNYIIKLRDKSGKLNSVLFMFDSNEYMVKDRKRVYDYIHEEQVQWYERETRRINEQEGRQVLSFAYMHIPLEEYREAWNAVINAEKSAIYYYGSRDEKISCQGANGGLFDKILELKSTKGIFCGHDHLNDFSVEYKGVRMTYGQSIDCLLYAKNLSEHKGATLLKIHKNGDFEIKGKKHR